MEQNKPKKSRRGLKQGAYSAGISAVVIAIVVVLNMVVGQMPASLTQFDISSVQLYTVSDTSKELLAGLEHDVKIVVLAQEDNTDERILKFLDNYAALSEHITVTEVDPVAQPSALTTYDAEENSLVVICEDTGKQTSIPFTDIITYEMDYYSYSYTESSFDAEGQLTTALDYVTGDAADTVYQMTGHDETELSDTVVESIEKSNITVGDAVNLLLTGAVPDDCSLLICNAPVSDLADDELTLLQEYLQNGGQLMILLTDTDNTLTNFEALMTEYGLQLADGYIADTSRHSQQSYYYIFPEYNSSSSLVSSLDSDKNLTLMVNCHGMTEITPARDSITVETFLQTSSGGVAVADEQVQGTYILGAVATEEGGGRLTVIGSSYLIDESLIGQSANLYNMEVFMNAVTGGFEHSANISIEAKSLEMTYNTIANAGLWSVIFIVMIPVATLVGGLVYWTGRRKR